VERRQRKVADRSDAEALLASWQESGLGLAEFSRSEGVDGRSLHCWRLNLRRQKQAPQQPAPRLRLVELALPAHQARYRVIVDDLQIEIGDDFREDTLARLLRVVGAC